MRKNKGTNNNQTMKKNPTCDIIQLTHSKAATNHRIFTNWKNNELLVKLSSLLLAVLNKYLIIIIFKQSTLLLIEFRLWKSLPTNQRNGVRTYFCFLQKYTLHRLAFFKDRFVKGLYHFIKYSCQAINPFLTYFQCVPPTCEDFHYWKKAFWDLTFPQKLKSRIRVTVCKTW